MKLNGATTTNSDSCDGVDWQLLTTISPPTPSSNSWSSSITWNPQSDGYWCYGMHILDRAGNYITEYGAGFIKPVIVTRDTYIPTVDKFTASTTTLDSAHPTVTFTIEVSDTNSSHPFSSGLKKVELWRKSSPWQVVASTTVSGSSAAVTLSDTPSEGTSVYGVHTVDAVGNVGTETSTITVTKVSNQPPQATELYATSTQLCTRPSEYFSWTFSDPNPGDYQSAYQLQVAKDAEFLNLVIDTGKVDGDTHSMFRDIVVNPGEGQLGYNTTYYWRVKVWDSYDTASSWAVGSGFQTPSHLAPSVDFIWKPDNPALNEYVQFCSTKEKSAKCNDDKSTCYDTNNNPISCTGKTFKWTFPDNVQFSPGSSPASENPKVKFTEKGNYSITLTITDDAASCSKTQNIRIGFTLPKWQEAAP